jgi:hypothetical protein
LVWQDPVPTDSRGYYYIDTRKGDREDEPVSAIEGTKERMDELADDIDRRRKAINEENVRGGRSRKSRRVKKRHVSRRAKRRTRRSKS